MTLNPKIDTNLKTPMRYTGEYFILYKSAINFEIDFETEIKGKK